MPLRNIANKNSLSLDNVCALVAYAVTFDNIGNNIETPTETMCYCAELPVISSEFFNAGQSGIKSECVLLVDTEGYESQIAVKYDDVVYSVYRTYVRGDGMTELYLTKKVGV